VSVISYEVLAKHRFASHVCQTLFTVATETIAREVSSLLVSVNLCVFNLAFKQCRGILPDIPDSSDHGELRNLTQLVLDICQVGPRTGSPVVGQCLSVTF
jgi:nucleolar protein 9